tara:strand:- start:179 stop:817 length:639 start_codon:yes stop_codon:yes gene_type:complete
MATIKGLHAFLIKEQFRKTLQAKGYAFFGLENKAAYNVNIIGVRSDEDIFNKFDDALVVIYRDRKRNWEVRSYSITTDPGKIWQEKPMNSKGCAILVPDQYRGVYKIDGHGVTGYPAMCQRLGNVKVFRDPDRDHEHDRDAGTIDEGMFGINIHRSRKYGEADLVNSYSAGCQVFKNTTDFNDFMKLANKSADKFGNSFTYTLISEGDLIGY